LETQQYLNALFPDNEEYNSLVESTLTFIHDSNEVKKVYGA